MPVPFLKLRLILVFVTAFAVTFLATPLAIWASRRFGVLDRPDDRKVHRNPTGRLGGLAIALGTVFAVLAYTSDIRPMLLPFVAGGALIVLTGVYDDLFDLKPTVKLGGQVLAAVALIWFGVGVEAISGFAQGTFVKLGWLRTPLAVFWIVAITNMINFIDGLDGLAAGVSFIAAVSLAVVNYYDKLSPVSVLLLAGIAGSSLAFLRYNWHPAKIFMGDTGSMFLGFTLGVASTMGAFKGATLAIVIVPFVALLVPIADLLFAILRRVKAERPIFKADKGHIHHQFLRLGFRHDRAVLAIYALSAALGASAVFISRLKSIYAAILLAALALAVGGGMALFVSRSGRSRDARPPDRPADPGPDRPPAD